MNDIAATIGLANIGGVTQLIARQQMNAIYYDRHLESYEVSRAPLDHASACWLYTILVKDRQGFISHMADRGVACSPVHARNDTHAGFYYPNGPLPGVDHFASQNVAIPVHWDLTEADLRAVVEAVKAWSR